ncbi:hypothetical protein [Shewanella scandinavica]|uniref:hypothetical protein n=1 Tax=Shewanella scandinavica TaxID=3063538 RepID=UPI0031866A00
MASKRKIKPTTTKNTSDSTIKPRISNEQGVITFSFKYLQLTHPSGKFCIKAKDGSYLFTVLDRLKAISTIKTSDFRVSGGKALRVHKIDWNGTSEKNGFSHLNEELQLAMPFQFQISSNEYGRVHGFLIDDVFYTVWFDPYHQLYPGT